jgi:hypothetical protein
MSAHLSELAELGVGVVIWCSGPGCDRPPRYLPIEDALARFGPVTCAQAQRRLKCDQCGARGRDGRVTLLPSTLDIADIRLGLPPGTTERAQIARRTRQT